jgi:hypothetical protein
VQQLFWKAFDHEDSLPEMPRSDTQEREIPEGWAQERQDLRRLRQAAGSGPESFEVRRLHEKS